MEQPNNTAWERFDELSTRQPQGTYNFQHFRTKHLVEDAQRTWNRRGIEPGAMAPDFELPDVDGGRVRLSSLRGKPVLLHFGSYT